MSVDVTLCDVYVKDQLRASLPPILSTVSEEGSTPSTRGKSAKLAAGTCIFEPRCPCMNVSLCGYNCGCVVV